MDEDKKRNFNYISNNAHKENKKKNNIEIKELRLGKLNPSFNLVCLKARYRLNELEKKFTKSQYKDYIRKCKNMYSISRDLNNKYTISDLYTREKFNINNIFSVFHKIDSKLGSQKIKVTKIKKNKFINFADNKSLSCTNFYRKKSNIKNNIFLNYRKNLSRNIREKSTNNKKVNSTSYEASNSINNQMSKTAYEFNKKIIKIDKNKTIVNPRICLKNKFLLENLNKKRESNETMFSKFDFLINKNANDNKINKNKKRLKSTNLIYRIQQKQYSLSCKSSAFTITQHGGIIYNNSMFRNKNIVYLLPNNYNLPLLYKNAKI
jgi:hypothetical protein